MFNLLEIERQVIGPQAGSLTHGRWLSRLQMRESKACRVALSCGKSSQRVDNTHQPVAHQLESLPQQDQIGVIGHETARSAQMDNGPRQGTLVAIGVHVRHDIMPQLTLVLLRHVKIDLVDVCAHFLQLVVANIDSQFLLGLGQRDP